MSIYREYDIRGIFGKELNRDIVFNIGVHIAREIKKQNGTNIAIGYDARIHSPELFSWLVDGLFFENLEVYSLGMIPTPVAYFSLYNENTKISSSIMITGSHNPKEYNGFKITLFKKPFYGESIKKLRDSIESNFIEYKKSSLKPKSLPILNLYIDFLTKHFSHLKNFKYKIALDCGNGVAALGIKEVLDNLNISYLPLYFEPIGDFPNHHPDPSEEKNLLDLKNAMKENNIPIGIAFDGDGDRVALLSQNYNFKGDELAILFAKQMQKDGIFNPFVIGEVKCSSNMYSEINSFGKSMMYKTGHSNLKIKLMETGAHLAAEMSGHMFFNDRYFGYDDAIYAALRALELFLDSNVEEIENIIFSLPKMYSTNEEKINCSEEEKFKIIENLKENLKSPPKDFPEIIEIIDIDGLRVIFKDGWGLIRASNTTPVLVTRFESSSKEKALLYKQKLLSLIKRGENDNFK